MKIIAKFDSEIKMVIWCLKNPQYNDCEKYPTKCIGDLIYIIEAN